MEMPQSDHLEERPDLHKKPRARRKGDGEPSLVDRLPPHSDDAERGVLGCMLRAPKEAVGTGLSLIGKNDKVFYNERHQIIYRTLVEMYDRNEPIDLITVNQRLKDNQELDKIGGTAYLASLEDATPSAANLEYWFGIVLDKYRLRRMISTCTEIIREMYDFQGDVPRLMDEVETRILQLNEENIGLPDTDIKRLVNQAISIIENYHENQGALTGLATGFADLDRITCGLQPGEMIVIAARPSMGKTSLAMNIAEHVAVDMRQPVAVFSLEMTAEALALRLLCSRAKVNLRDVREGFLANRDFPKLTQAASELRESPLFIDDSSGLSILQLRARARRLFLQHGIKLFVIDYLQLLHSTATRARENRQQEIADISSGLKALAKELKVPVLVLSQLNRELEKDKSRKPRLSDLRESGAIEQDADVVGLLYRPQSGDEDEGTGLDKDDQAVTVNLLIAKQRNGPTGEVPLQFERGLTRFKTPAKISPRDVPATKAGESSSDESAAQI